MSSNFDRSSINLKWICEITDTFVRNLEKDDRALWVSTTISQMQKTEKRTAFPAMLYYISYHSSLCKTAKPLSLACFFIFNMKIDLQTIHLFDPKTSEYKDVLDMLIKELGDHSS